MASKPFKLFGAWFADAGGEVYNCGTSVPAIEPVFVSVNATVTTGLWSLYMPSGTASELSCQSMPTYQGSREEPGPRLWREPPAVDPLTLRLE